MVVGENTELPRKALPNRLDVGGGGHREREATPRAHFQPIALGIRKRAVDMALPVGQRRQHQPVFHRRAARKGQRREQTFGRHIGHSISGRVPPTYLSVKPR